MPQTSLLWCLLIEQGDLIVLDEAQSHPPVFKRMRSAIDRRRRDTRRFLLLGSVSPSLMRQVSESLTGWLGIVELTPFFLDEVGSEALDALWLRGGFPPMDAGDIASLNLPGFLARLAEPKL
jgi:predicted AAA+ superfamily ATPase